MTTIASRTYSILSNIRRPNRSYAEAKHTNIREMVEDIPNMFLWLPLLPSQLWEWIPWKRLLFPLTTIAARKNFIKTGTQRPCRVHELKHHLIGCMHLHESFHGYHCNIRSESHKECCFVLCHNGQWKQFHHTWHIEAKQRHCTSISPDCLQACPNMFAWLLLLHQDLIP